ncbi:MAG: two-component regulator propeller domain-containing protein [Gemmatimonadota bacterium]
MPRRLTWFLAVLLVSPHLSAQQPAGFLSQRFLAQSWSVHDGLPDSRLTAVLVSQEGFLWIGTRKGLARFDGDRFRTYTHVDYPLLPSDEILALAQDSSGTIWIGTQSGLAVYRLGRFAPIEMPESLRNLKIVSLLAMPGRGVVVGTTDRVFTIGQADRVPALTAPEAAQALVRTRTGEVWALSRSLYQLGSGGFHPDTSFTALQNERALTIDSTGGLWVSDYSHLAVRRPTAIGRTYQAIPDDSGLPAGSIRALATATDGAVWVAVDGAGVYRWDNHRFLKVAPLDSVAAGAVRVLTPAADGSMWIGSLTGLTHVWPTRFNTYRTGTNLARDYVWQLRPVQDGSIWLATNEAGPSRLVDGKLSPVPSRTPFPPRLVSALTQTSDGSIWLAFRGGGLGRYLNGDFTYEAPLAGPTSLEIRSILQDRHGTIWLGTSQGLYRREGSTFRLQTGVDGPSNPDIYVLRESGNGELWIGASNSLTRRDSLGQFHAVVRPTDGTLAGIEDLQPDGDRLWIATARDGIALYTGGRLTVFSTIVPGVLREAHRVLPDGLGFLWVTSNQGLQRLRIRDLLLIAAGPGSPLFLEDFDRDDGLITAEFNSTGGAAGSQTADGRLWFPSPVGVVEVDPSRFMADTAAPRAVIDQVLIDDREVNDDAMDQLNLRGGRLTIRYTVVSSIKGQGVRFRYRLSPADQGWIDAGPLREAVYQMLPSGPYTFAVQAGSGGNQWSGAAATLQFTLAPRLYERSWFLGLMATLLAVIGAGSYRWRTGRLVRQSRRLEDQVAERTGELRASRDQLEFRVAERTEQLRERTEQLEMELAQRTRLERQLVEAQQLESVGRLAGGVAHDINNLMTAVLGYAQLIEEAAHDRPGLCEDAQQIRLAAERAAGVSQQLLAFGRRQIFNPQILSVDDIVLALDPMLRRIVGASIEIVTLPAEALHHVKVDRVQIEQVIINLVANARDAMPSGGKLWLETRDLTLPVDTMISGVEVAAGSYVQLTVRDGGTGISPEHLPHIFEPFFTTKEVGKGSGMGLATSYGIIKQSGGTIVIESTPGLGSTFRILLPRTLEPSDEVPAARSVPTAGGDEVILLVEDEPQLRALAGRFLRRLGYTVLDAADGEEALRVVADTPHLIAVVVTDLVMPRMGGLELAERMRADGQHCRILMVSGFVEREVPPALIRQPGVAFLAKPFRLAELASRIRVLLDSPVDVV